MTSTIDPKQGEKVLEIGTGSGYQSAYLSHLTDKVYTIEIIKPLAERTRGIYDALINDGYNEFKAIHTRTPTAITAGREPAAAPAAAPTPAATPAMAAGDARRDAVGRAEPGRAGRPGRTRAN